MLETENYYEIKRTEWQTFNNGLTGTLTAQELQDLISLNDRLSLQDVRDVYVPLVHLFEVYYKNYRQLLAAKRKFLRRHYEPSPFIIGVTGSVAVGKSTTARLMQKLLQKLYPQKKTQMITTDGFLYPNAELEKRGKMDRKGFPESYDMKKLITFLLDVKTGQPEVKSPIYSHSIYDVVPGKFDLIQQPDILIIEGINVLQLPSNQRIYASDFFDFSIYVDAREDLIRKWYLERFEMLMDMAVTQQDNYYHDYAIGDRSQAMKMAEEVWENINLKNLREYIYPTITRADLVLHKTDHHYIDKLYIKKY